MLKTVTVVAAALWATQALGGPIPSMRLYPTFKPAHIRATITTFDVEGSTGTGAAAINAGGVIVGSYSYGNVLNGAFVRAANGDITTFEAPNAGHHHKGNGTTAAGINSAGDIAGTVTSNNISHGYLRLANGTFIEFDAPKSTQTYVTGLNSDDTIVGHYLKKGSNATRAFVRTSDGTVTTFGISDYSSPITFPTAINDAGAVTGYYFRKNADAGAFVMTSTSAITKFGLHDALDIVPAAINASGEIAGTFQKSAHVHFGFLRAPDGKVTKFKVSCAGSVEGEGTSVTALDDAGDVAGACTNRTGFHGFERSAGGAVATFDVNSANETIPSGINSAGTITGSSGSTGFVWNK